MRLDTALAELEPLRDAGVGQSFGYEIKHPSLALSGRGERVIGGAAGQEVREHVRVEHRPAAGQGSAADRSRRPPAADRRQMMVDARLFQVQGSLVGLSSGLARLCPQRSEELA